MQNDYSAWLRSAEAFIRSMSRLPGPSAIDIDIAPPFDSREADKLHGSLPHGLPAVLRDFYSTASRRAKCTYRWTPPEDIRQRVWEFVPYRYTYYGGVDLCAADEYEEHQQALFDVADIYDDLGGEGPAAAATLRNCAPLIAMDGDYVVERMSGDLSSPRVLYFCHEIDVGSESPLEPLSEDGETFMTVWEQLRYLSPAPYPWIEYSPARLLDAETPQARGWRELLATLLRPNHDHDSETSVEDGGS